jgi:hypothetical protein
MIGTDFGIGVYVPLAAYWKALYQASERAVSANQKVFDIPGNLHNELIERNISHHGQKGFHDNRYYSGL